MIPKIPSLKNYEEEKAIWIEAGRPVRSDEQVAEIFKTCSSNECGEYIRFTQNKGQCAVCTCILRSEGDYMNKLRWATTKCPLGFWIEEENAAKLENEKTTTEAVVEEVQNNGNQLGVPNRPQNSCGCR